MKIFLTSKILRINYLELIHISMTSTFRGREGWGKAKMRCYRTLGGGGSECSGRPTFFFITENWICPITRYLAESNINISLIRNLPIDSDVRQ